MNTKEFRVPNISCNHCVMTIKRELGAIAGVQQVEASLDTKKVDVTWEAPATWDGIKALLTEINYAPEE